MLVTSDDHYWRPVQTFSLQTSADIWWLLKHIWSAQTDGTHSTGMVSCIYLYVQVDYKGLN